MSDTPIAQNGNKPTFDSLLADVTKIAEEGGKAHDSQIRHFLKVIDGAFLGVLSTDPDKHGKGISDTEKLSAACMKAASGASMFSIKTVKKMNAVTNLAIRFGMCSKFSAPGEPVQTMNTLVTLWRKLRADPANKGQLIDCANAAAKYAREQLKRNSLIGETELRGYCFKPGKEPKTAEELLDDIRKTLRKLVAGSACKGNALDDSPEVKEMIKQADKRMLAIAKAKAPQSGMATPSKVSTTGATP